MCVFKQEPTVLSHYMSAPADLLRWAVLLHLCHPQAYVLLLERRTSLFVWDCAIPQNPIMGFRGDRDACCFEPNPVPPTHVSLTAPCADFLLEPNSTRARLGACCVGCCAVQRVHVCGTIVQAIVHVRCTLFAKASVCRDVGGMPCLGFVPRAAASSRPASAVAAPARMGVVESDVGWVTVLPCGFLGPCLARWRCCACATCFSVRHLCAFGCVQTKQCRAAANSVSLGEASRPSLPWPVVLGLSALIVNRQAVFAGKSRSGEVP
jgi:hypothetical protein